MTTNATRTLWLLAGTGLLLVPIFAACEDPSLPGASEQTNNNSQAVHDEGLFELDGDPQAEGGGAAGDDWEDLLPDVPTVDAVNGSIFTGGSTKDINDISVWQHKNGSVPDKDDILNGAAATYTDSSTGDLILYFSADRFSTSGDSQIGFWFLQNEVTLNTDGTFEGGHKEGDLLVLSDFTNGGALGTISVCEWVGGDGTAGHLECQQESVQPAPGFPGVFCTADSDGVIDDIACATINNSDGTESVWDYDPKMGPNDIYKKGAFFEGGVNATRVLGRSPCFATFLVETRASQEPTATLKDFIRGDLAICQPSVDVCKQCNVTLETQEVSEGVTQVVVQLNYSGWACNTGNVDMNFAIEDSVDTTANPLFDGNVAAESCIAFSGNYLPGTSDTDPTTAEFTNTVTLTATHPDLDDIVETFEAACGVCGTPDTCPDPPFEIPSP